MRVHVAFTPAEEVGAPVGIVVDVLRATSTICQALAAGYRRVLCCGEVDEAREVAAREGNAVLAGERQTVLIPGFDFGNSPREFLEPAADTLVLTTCAGVRGELALDDAYCAGRIAETLGGDPADSAVAAIRLAHTFGSGEKGLSSSQSARNLQASGLDGDIAWCARESVLEAVPRFSRMLGSVAEVTL